MTPDQATYQDSHLEYSRADTEYKDLLIKYSSSLLAAEVAVIGFLLQNPYSHALLGHTATKSLYLAAILFTSAALTSLILDKSIIRRYHKAEMDRIQYDSLKLSKGAINVFGRDYKMSGDFDSRARKEMRNVVRYTSFQKRLFGFAEISLTLGVISAGLFVARLIIGL